MRAGSRLKSNRFTRASLAKALFDNCCSHAAFLSIKEFKLGIKIRPVMHHDHRIEQNIIESILNVQQWNILQIGRDL